MDNKDNLTRIKPGQNSANTPASSAGKDAQATIIKKPSATDNIASSASNRQLTESSDEGKTRIQSMQAKPGAATVEPPEDGYNESTKKIKVDAIALTRINNAFQSQDTSKGFEQARKDANQALADSKIILNKRFVLESTLGSGGMGTVYKAQDLRKVEANDLNPYVAAKVLNSNFQEHPDAFVTLQREASRSHILSHPNIITVHDFDRDGDIFFMTMELLEGQGMEVVLRNVKDAGLPVDEALGIINDYCTAVEYAHQKNIIHSDLKPGNIFITESGAKVLDFGIARFTADSQLTNDFDAGTLGAMTPAYASLEMLQYQPPSPGDDVFAAAVIAYELFTGKHPYGRKPADQALAENLKPERIDTLSKRQWKALASALALKGSERTPSVQQFLDELMLKKKFPVFKLSSLLLLMLVSWFAYIEYFMPDKLTTVLNNTLDKANECYSEKDYSCAIDSSKAVLKMSPGHKEAGEVLERAERAFLEQRIHAIQVAANQCLDKNSDVICANKKLQELNSFAADSPQATNLSQRIVEKEREIFINNTMDAAYACMTEQDYACVQQKTAEILRRDAGYKVAAELAKEARALLANQQRMVDRNNQEFKTRMDKARGCFNRKDYACAIEYSSLALKSKPGNGQAETLYQKSKYASFQQTENLQRANKVLRQGYACFELKNYSCSIAKSESALEFVPGHKEAIELKNKAKNEIKKLKNSFIIN